MKRGEIVNVMWKTSSKQEVGTYINIAVEEYDTHCVVYKNYFVNHLNIKTQQMNQNAFDILLKKAGITDKDYSKLLCRQVVFDTTTSFVNSKEYENITRIYIAM